MNQLRIIILIKSSTNQRGSALIKVMVFFSILMIIAATSATMIQSQAKQIKKTKKKEEIYSLTKNLKTIVESPAHCNAMLAGKVLASNKVTLSSVPQNRNEQFISTNQTVSGSLTRLTINKIEFSDIENWQDPYYKGYLTVSFESNDNDNLRPIRIPKYVKVVSGIITECVDVALYSGEINTGAISITPTYSGRGGRCPKPDEWVAYAEAKCFCGGSYSAAVVSYGDHFLVSWSTGEYYAMFGCVPSCDTSAGDKIEYRLGCISREGQL